MSQKVYDAIIVGAGIAGVKAAADLSAAGRSVALLEGRDRIGGRLYTDRTSGSSLYELGGSWYHQTLDNPLYDLALKLGIKPEYDDVGPGLYDNNGPLDPEKKLGQASSDFAPWSALYFQKHAETKDLPLGELVEIFLKEHPNLTDIQKREVRRILEIPVLPNGTSPAEVSSKYGSIAPLGRDAFATGGYDTIVNHVAKPINKDSIHLSTTVTEIKKLGDGSVEVLTEQGTKFAAKYVVVTAPIGVLQSGNIEFTPPLPETVTAAISGLGIADIGKTYFEFDKVFWPTDVGKFVFVGSIKGRYTPILVSNWYLYNGAKKHPGVFLIIPAPLIGELEVDPSKAFETLKPVLESLRTDSTQPIPKPTRVTVTKWGSDKFTQGAISRAKVGIDPAEPIKGFEAGADSIRFAGEHTIYRGFTFAHGAWLSGEREAKYILSKL